MEVELLIGTKNRGKVREIKNLLEEEQLKIICHSLVDYNITVHPEETGKTFQENARIKSVFYSSLIRDTFVIGEDSGLEVKVLNGEPGIFSSRYAGKESNDSQNINKLLGNMENINDREAKFVSVISVAKNGDEIQSFKGEVEGEIIHEKRGKKGFGYDPIFLYPPLKKTFAQLTLEQKNRISHRAKSINQLKNFLKINK